MAKVIVMPKLGFTQNDGQVVEWHKQPGDELKKGEVFFDAMTDKSVVPVKVMDEGVLLKIVLEPNITVPVFTPIAVVGQPGENPDDALSAVSGEESLSDEAKADSGEEAQPESSCENRAPKLSPKAKRLLNELGLERSAASVVKGTGFEGGVTAADILAHGLSADKVKATPLARKAAEKDGLELASVTGTGARGKITKADVDRAARANNNCEGEKRVLSVTSYAGIRRVIGERLSQSKFTAPHLYFMESVDTTELNAFRERVSKLKGEKISVTDILVMAASKALTAYPGINSSLVGDKIETYESTNVGVAVAGEKGLLVPVIKNVQDKSLSEVAAESKDLVQRARTGALDPSEYTGGTFTITNLGMFGVKSFTAIINPPESAILGVSAVVKTPVVVTDENGEDSVVIRPMMNIQLSVDHRLVDGMLAVQFLEYFKKLLEEPLMILI